ncbi:hypothetical protein [Tenacibaculum soleae]|uniref:hypothetical protein n=1 Tax=Tenacibaculum soleae TaxID=447689 RepID=UPI0026E2E872|nr:hypothetical protein [Tenacibaculum soleae]MDO6814056.1 hypothetical protein [Tenacibaculum soleae]
MQLSDSLTYKTEIRIYQGGGITNYSSLLRMFKNKSNQWTTEFYEHYAKVNQGTELKIEKRILKPKNDTEFIYQNLVRSYILDLPSQEKIEWKLGVRNDIQKEETILPNGKIIVEYHGTIGKKSILDGVSYKIKVRGFNSNNNFEYSSPESYLKHYPEVDELIYICEILTIVRNEFEIWKK